MCGFLLSYGVCRRLQRKERGVGVPNHEKTFWGEYPVAEAPDEATLLDVMNKAKENGDLSFEMAGTMVASIEGIANDIDYNPCWMLYTTDDELSNTEWGTVTMEDEVLGSAILGADTLPVEEGESYVWAYCEF